MRYILSSVLVGAALFACDDHTFSGGAGHSSTDAGSGAEALLKSSCASCHSGTQSPNFAEDICETVVDVDAEQLASMKLIAPNDPENSYLLHKIKGTHTSVGGTGGTMPPSGTLSEEQITLIEDWISAGAECGEAVGTEADVANGEEVVNSTCNVCHGVNTTPFADLAPNKSDGEIINAIKNGYGGMPAQAAVSDYAAMDVLAYLRAEYGEYVEEVSPLDIDDDSDGFTENQGDCDDTDPDINPDAADDNNDGVDDNCDGTPDDEYIEPSDLDTDDDGDGVTENEGDCNDTDPDINPSATDDNNDGVDDNCDGTPDEGYTVTWTTDIEPLFQPYGCAGCHYGFFDLTTILSTNAGDNYNTNAGASMPWVTPNEPENSYLYHKIAGTQASVGGGGDQMPQYASAMSAAEIELVERWILGGAN